MHHIANNSRHFYSRQDPRNLARKLTHADMHVCMVQSRVLSMAYAYAYAYVYAYIYTYKYTYTYTYTHTHTPTHTHTHKYKYTHILTSSVHHIAGNFRQIIPAKIQEFQREHRRNHQGDSRKGIVR